jgi:hypothetical protein
MDHEKERVAYLLSFLLRVLADRLQPNARNQQLETPQSGNSGISFAELLI